MLKLPKGLKKKKKDKKSKKNQELFTEEELAAYKQREQREKQEAAEAAVQAASSSANSSAGASGAGVSGASGTATSAADDADEWRKFTALTSGIDTVLKKTQGNLDRLKESSFYQREPTKCQKEEQQREVAKQREQAAADAAQAELEQLEQAATAKNIEDLDQAASAVVELSESESESEEADDIFDTTYIDDLASRGVELYVPESPTNEVDDGPDPFDTNYAEKVIKGPEVSKRGKKLVHIGAAVEVLTGRVEKVASTSTARRPRRGIQNLLLQSFDEGTASGGVDAAEGTKAESPVRTLLDDISDDIPGGPIDLSVSLHLQFIKKDEKELSDHSDRNEHSDVQEVISEFDILSDSKADEFDEFAELAAESLTTRKDVQILKQVPANNPIATSDISGDWASFQPDPNNVQKAKPPVRPPPPKALLEAAIVAAAVIDPSEEFPTPDDEDPFDTSFAQRVLPLEDDFDFDPRADDVPVPIKTLDENTLAQVDPFDTTGKASSDNAEDDIVVDIPSAADLNRRKSSLSLNIGTNQFGLKSVGFASDFLAVNTGVNVAGKIQKPLTPYYSEQLDEEKEIDDPFDTSFVPPRKPSKVELTLLERDLLAGGLHRSISDPDFDPRAVTPCPTEIQTTGADLLAVNEVHNIKVLTPAQNEGRLLGETSLDSYVDPFDTSAVNQTILPGRAELKIIESELLPAVVSDITTRISVLDSCSDSQELGLGDKVLTPQVPLSTEHSLEEQDPFDTSIANNLAPGQVEIKLLESELINQ